jgi:hypothetical protein
MEQLFSSWIITNYAFVLLPLFQNLQILQICISFKILS